MIHFSHQFRSRVTSEFINAISRVLQKLLKHFDGATIFTFAILILLALSVIPDLNSIELESVMLSSLFSLNRVKYGPAKTPYLDNNHAVNITIN